MFAIHCYHVIQATSEQGALQESGLGSAAATTTDLQQVGSSFSDAAFATAQTTSSSAFDGFSPHQQSSDAASMSLQDTAKVDTNTSIACLFISCPLCIQGRH